MPTVAIWFSERLHISIVKAAVDNKDSRIAGARNAVTEYIKLAVKEKLERENAKGDRSGVA